MERESHFGIQYPTYILGLLCQSSQCCSNQLQASKTWQLCSFWCSEQHSGSLPGFPAPAACRNLLGPSDTHANLKVCGSVEVNAPRAAPDQEGVEAGGLILPSSSLQAAKREMHYTRVPQRVLARTDLWLMIRYIKYARIGCFFPVSKPPILFLGITSPN